MCTNVLPGTHMCTMYMHVDFLRTGVKVNGHPPYGCRNGTWAGQDPPASAFESAGIKGVRGHCPTSQETFNVFLPSFLWHKYQISTTLD